MPTITLQEPALVEEVERVSQQEGLDTAAFVAEAVRRHLATYRQKRLFAETEAWYNLPAEKRRQYEGKFVAVYGGQVVDSDPDRLKLYHRLRARFGRQTILIMEGGISLSLCTEFGHLDEAAMSTRYSRQNFPPAPILEIKLSQPGESAQLEAKPALIDTGGDFTTVPLTWLLQIDAPEARWAYLRGLWSEQRPVTLYLVDLHFESAILPGVEVIGIDEGDIETEDDREIVLGRNVLNQLILLLDGPNQQTDVLERRPVRF